MLRLFIEAAVVGLLLLIIIVAINYIYPINDNTTLYTAVFFTGALMHLLFEFAGANSWYCKHGYTVTK